MPSFIVKPERDVDFYVVWSTVVDSVTYAGSRAELIADLGTGVGTEPARFARADRHGSSVAGDHVGYLGWAHETFMVGEPLGEQRTMPRRNLRAFAEAVLAADVPAAFALTDPLDVGGDGS
jgi:hypothetical protein